MTLALQRRYILDLQFQDRHGEPAPAGPARAQAPAADRGRPDLAVGDIGEAEAVERLELTLDALDEYEDLRDGIPDLPFDDLVAKICKDLGLPADWRERAQARIDSGAMEMPHAERGDPIRLDERDGFEASAPPCPAKAQRRGLYSDFPEPPG